MTQETQNWQVAEKEEESVSLLEILERYLRYWKWIFLSLAVFLIMGYLYARYKTPVYESTATLLIEEDKPNGGGGEELGMLKDLGLMSGGSVIEDEIELLKSRSVMERVVKDLQLNWTYQNIGIKTGLVRSELYEICPIKVHAVGADSLLYEKMYSFSVKLISGEKFEVTDGSGVTAGSVNYGVVLNTPAGKLIVERSPAFNSTWIGKTIQMSLNPFRDVVSATQSQLNVEAVSKDANVIVLKIKGSSIEKNNAILNEIITKHEENAIIHKNQIVRNTTSFINDRMKFIAAELSDVEKTGESYKTQHQLVDVTTDAAIYLEKESDIEKRVIETTIEMNLADFVNEFIIEQRGYDQLLPANLGFKDLSVAQMTNSYNELVLERNRLKEVSGDKNPGVARIEAQLSSLRSSLESSLRNLKRSLAIQLKKLKSEEQIYQSKIASVPQFEREYRDILRQQQIKETLYLFLLQKREENEISLAATVANTQVIDQAFSTGTPVSPQKKIIYLGAFLIGLLLPVGLIYLRGLLNNKVQSRADIESAGLNVIGDVPEFGKNEDQLVLRKPQSSVAEAFRVLRANLAFVFPAGSEGGKVISITSSLGGEGKSFASVNLAYIYAATGKKVVLMGMDLRKPRLNQYLDIPNGLGLSNYLANTELTLDKIVQPVNEGTAVVDVITSGDIPPNPSELLMSNRLDDLVAELKTKYDFIIFDNGPVGLVADAIVTNRLSDVTLYIVRANKIDKRILVNAAGLHKTGKLRNMFVVLNAVKIVKGTYGYYGYGYGEEVEKTGWRRFLKRK